MQRKEKPVTKENRRKTKLKPINKEKYRNLKKDYTKLVEEDEEENFGEDSN